MSTFDSTKTPLPDIIREITDGKVQLPISSAAGFGMTNTSVHCL